MRGGYISGAEEWEEGGSCHCVIRELPSECLREHILDVPRGNAAFLGRFIRFGYGDIQCKYERNITKI